MGRPNVNVNVYGNKSGMTKTYSTVVLRQTKTVAEQLIDPNTIYEIRYDFDLNGETITVPEDCVLEFKGGSFSNGELIGQNTVLDAGFKKVFDISVELSGSWSINESFPEWFGAKGDGITNDTVAIQKAIDLFNVVTLTNCYLVDTLSINTSCIISDGTIISNSSGSLTPTGIINVLSDDVAINGVKICGNFENVTDTYIIGINAEGILSDTLDENGYKTFIHKLANLKIQKCTISNVRVGISCSVTDSALITDNNIDNIAYTGIEVLSSHNAIVSRNIIKNININHYYNNSYGVCISNHAGGTYPPCVDVEVEGNIVSNNPYWEAYDTHCGIRISFINNVASNVKVGVMVTRDNARNSAQNCLVSQNILKGVDAENYYGINVIGVPATSPGGNDYKIIEGCTVLNNTVSNFYGGIHCYLTSSIQVDNNNIYNCIRGIAWESFQNDVIRCNVIVIDEEYSDEVKYGIILNKLSTGPSVTGKLYIKDNNIYIKGENSNHQEDSYAVYAKIDLSLSAFYVIGNNNTIRVDRTADEIAEDTALGIIKTHRWYGLPDTDISLVYRCFMYVDVLGLFYCSSSGSTSITANASKNVVEIDSKLFPYQNNLIKPSIQYSRDAAGLIFSANLQTADKTMIVATNTTNSNISLASCNFYVTLNGRPYLY